MQRKIGWGVLGALAVVSLSLLAAGQPRKNKAAKPRVVEDAQVTEAADAAASPSADPVVAAPPGDGGARVSPLTPEPAELPRAMDGGAAVDYEKLIAEAAALRARAAAAGDMLFRSKIAVSVRVDGKAKVAKLSIFVDEGQVYAAPSGFKPDDFTSVYDHAISPGRHTLTIEGERRDDRDESFRVLQRSKVVVDVPKDERVEMLCTLSDDSTMGADFPSDKSGRYDARVKCKVSSRAAK